jgi:hypothetical protein
MIPPRVWSALSLFCALGGAVILLGLFGVGDNTPVPSNPSQVATATSPHCPGDWEVITVGPAPVVISDGLCVVKPQVNVLLKFTDSDGRSIVVGPAGGSFPTFWAKTVQTVGTEVETLHYRRVLTP